MSRGGRRWTTARLRRLVVGTLLAAVVGLGLATPVGPWLVRERPLDDPDVILVLGSHESERLPHAAALARRWPSARVWLTEPVTPTVWNCQDCANRGRTLAAWGVRPDRVSVLTPRVRHTGDELVAAAQTMARDGHRRLLIVSSPYHTRRVAGLARARLPGVDVGVQACPVAGGLARPWWSRRYDRRYVLYELGALVQNSWRDGLTPSVWLVGLWTPRV